MAVRGQKTSILCAAAFFAVLLLLALDLCLGSSGIGLSSIMNAIFGSGDGAASDIVWKIRFPRALAALLAGACLAVNGLQMQSLFRNPLADPHILGVSSGAGLGAVLVICLVPALMKSGVAVSLAAFLGAALASLAIFAISIRTKGNSTLLVAGVMLGFAFSALTSVTAYLSDESSLKLFYSWSAGSFSAVSSEGLALMAGGLLLVSMISLLTGPALDLLAFGDEYASSCGVQLRRVRNLAMLGCCLSIAVVTAFCGPIGFVGIVSPHIARKLTGRASVKAVMPVSLFCGAVITLAADIISQSCAVPVPIGCTVAILGIPLIFIIMRKGGAL